MDDKLSNKPAERRKLVRLKIRPDLQHVEQRYEGKRFHVVKDPVCLRYYRFNQQEYFVFSLFDGGHAMEDVRKKFEDEYKPHRLEFQDLEAFARQLVTAGLVQHEHAGTGSHLFQRRAKQRNMKRLATFTNILYIKIPVFDPDRLLAWMYQYLWWIFTPTFFTLSLMLMFAALMQVGLHFNAFYDKMPQYQEFFAYQTVLYMWISLGIVKVIHEFGHGLSCKAFKGECHEMGVLLMCLSPALYANVTDAWTVADKWKRIIISFAGIYVELLIASISTFVWWYTPHLPVVNNIAMCLMVLCSVSTVLFNANPLMRFDGYYMLADWLEIPNLRDRANKYLNGLFLTAALGVEQPPEQYMAPSRKLLFFTYAVTSWIYRWVVTFGIIWFLSDFLNPKLKVLSRMLAVVSLLSMFVMPTYKMIRSTRQRGRLPDMKSKRYYTSLAIFAALILAFVFLPLPISRVRETGLIAVDPDYAKPVGLSEAATLTAVLVKEGEFVRKGAVLAKFESKELNDQLAKLRAELAGERAQEKLYREQASREVGRSKEELDKYATSSSLRVADAERAEKEVLDRIARVSELRAPADGNVMGVPSTKDIGRYYSANFTDAPPLMTVADPSKLVVKLPVTPMQYRLIKEDLYKKGTLDVAVHVPGRTDRVYEGKLIRLPDSDEKRVPPQLTQRGGGPLSVKPAGENGQESIPVSQIYLVQIPLSDTDTSARPGTLAQTKVYCQWRSGGWWCRWKLAEALDLGLYQ